MNHDVVHSSGFDDDPARGVGAGDGVEGASSVRLGTPQQSELRERLRRAGIVLLTCDAGGRITARQAKGQDWLTDVLCGSVLFRSMLSNAVRQWDSQEEPELVEASPGLWLVPTPIMNRRRRSGFTVAVIVSEPFPGTEELAAMCQAARMDQALCRTKLAELPPASRADVSRLALMIKWVCGDQLSLDQRQGELDSIGRELAESYEEMNLLYTIIQSMTVQERPERFVAIACQELLKVLSYGWIGAQFGRGDDLKSLAGRLIVAGDCGVPAAELRRATQRLLEEIGQRTVESGLIENGILSSNVGSLAAQSLVLKRQSKLGELLSPRSSALVQPLASDGEIIGFLIAGNKTTGDGAVTSMDQKLLEATASHLAIFLENAALYDDLNAMFMGTLEALTASIDAKDRYTCGHSRRVALLTQQLARAIGLDEHTVSRCHIAGLVHDVGKIGVPEAVLLKPGKLTSDEYEWIRRHPEIGYRILKDIPQLTDILPGVLHHHERWDGRGYPHGLAGEAIPLLARVIALADSFDAMSSTRTYRSAMSRVQVLDEIVACTGSQYDPHLASVFVKLDFSEFDHLVKSQHASEGGTADAAFWPRGDGALETSAKLKTGRSPSPGRKEAA